MNKNINSELLESIEVLTREKGVDEEDVYTALEQSLLQIAMERYGDSPDLSVSIDRDTGAVNLYYAYTVSESPSHVYEMTLKEAKLVKDDAQPGDKIKKKLDFGDFSRSSQRLASNELFRNIESLRRIREYTEFKDKVDTLITGVVKKIFPNGDLVVALGKGIGFLPAKFLIPSEVNEKRYRPGNNIKAYITEVKENTDIRNEQYQIVLSRTNDKFLVELLTLEVPEIRDGQVEIKGCVRLPGVRAKIAVMTHDRHVDPLGACIGSKGSRISTVIEELKGEAIDVIYWSENTETFAINALKPAEIQKAMSVDGKLMIIVDAEQKNRAIGFKGSNIILASALTGVQISVFTAAEEQARHKEICTFLDNALDIDATMSDLLVKHGFESVNDLKHATDEDIAALPGFDLDLAQALRERVHVYMQSVADFYHQHADIDPGLKFLPGMKMIYARKLYELGFKTMVELSKIDTATLMEHLKEFNVSEMSAKKILVHINKKLNSNTFKPASNRNQKRRKYDDLSAGKNFARKAFRR